MSVFIDLIKVARLSPNLAKVEDAAKAAKAASAALAKKSVQYADIPPGKELPGLNRVESADAINQFGIYRDTLGLDPAARVNIPLYAGGDHKDWRGIYETMKRTNQKTWWGHTTGDVVYDRHVIDHAFREKNEIGVDVVRMTPQEYINIIQDFPDKSTPTDSFLAETIRTGQPEYSSSAAQKNIDDYARKMVKEGNTPLPVLDYVNHKRDGLLRAMAAQRLGIHDMPVTVIRSNAPAEVLIRVEKETGIYRADTVRADTAGAKPKDLFGSITTKFSRERNEVMVEYSKLKPEHYGRGLGLEMYETLIQKVVKDGHKFASDDTLSPEAYRVWGALQKQGYRVWKNPMTREIKIGGETAYRGPPGQPIFKVTALPRGPEKPLKVAPKATREQINTPNISVNALQAHRQRVLKQLEMDQLRGKQLKQMEELKAAAAQKPPVAKPPAVETKVIDEPHTAEMQFRQFQNWLKEQKLPPGFDKDMLEQASWENASDVPTEKMFEVAKSTVHQYMDDLESAFDAGITNEMPQ